MQNLSARLQSADVMTSARDRRTPENDMTYLTLTSRRGVELDDDDRLDVALLSIKIQLLAPVS